MHILCVLFVCVCVSKNSKSISGVRESTTTGALKKQLRSPETHALTHMYVCYNICMLQYTHECTTCMYMQIHMYMCRDMGEGYYRKG